MREGICIWFTGLPSSGKSTLARRLFSLLQEKGYLVKLFDGDEVREKFFPEAGFSKEARINYLLKVAELVKKELSQNQIVICAFVSPYREIREKLRKEIGKNRFVEVFVDCPLEVCEKRNTRGLYRLAREGKIENFTGISDPYEPPEKPEIHLRTDLLSVEECVEKIFSYFLINKNKEEDFSKGEIKAPEKLKSSAGLDALF